MIEQGTHVAAGRFFGAAALGQFTLSNNLVRTPANHLVVSLQSVLFPMAARAHHNDAGLRRAYLTALAGVGLVAFPTFAFVATMADPIVQVLLGSRWIEAAPVLAALSTAMIPHAAMAICGPLLNGRGEPEIEFVERWIVGCRAQEEDTGGPALQHEGDGNHRAGAHLRRLVGPR
jgi:PST family polysaccharide transporter